MDEVHNSSVNDNPQKLDQISQNVTDRGPSQVGAGHQSRLRKAVTGHFNSQQSVDDLQSTLSSSCLEQTPASFQANMDNPPQTGNDEAESLLVEQARKDPAAFGAVYERYVDRVYGYIFHRVGNVHDAEDLTARTFYRALDKLHTYEDRGLPFSAWLFRIAHNLVANWHRDRSRRRFLSLDRIWNQSQQSDTPEEKVERDERHAALWSAINRLPKERKNLLLYKFGSLLSNIEIGDLMGKSESAIKSLYFRTLSSLRSDLESRGWNTAMNDVMADLSEAAGESSDETGGQSDEVA